MKLNILIIGIGNFGSKYIKIINKNFKKINIHVYDTNNKNILNVKKKFRNIIYLNNLSLINNIHGMIIATPAHTHSQYAALALKNKIPFLSEKPIGTDLKNWLKIKNQSKKINLISGIGYPRRYLKASDFIKKIIKTKKLGNLIAVNSNFSQDFRALRPNYENSYYPYKKKGGGIILDAVTHHLDWISFFCGKLSKLILNHENKIIKNIDGSDYAVLILKFKNKVSGLIIANQFQKPNCDFIELIFDKGNIKYNRISGNLKIINSKKTIKNYNFYEDWEFVILSQISVFFKSVKINRNLLRTSLDDDYHNLKFLLKNT